ncbi:amidohydrolase family protein [Pseudovibrio sp. WM33]|uniref:amidohydrolase family protein n=1 Tax=Pseudovibrio sp. WM33 TaxID=1735585 RepID=UPI0007AED45D|nr:amidohydrolase family protein [Pseudovibrio sp. WM33]KZL26334.1 Amidohydrolase [Pseudovibrio sp. WM33]
MLRIDAHHHFWKLSRGDYSWLTPKLNVLYRDFLTSDIQPLLTQAKMDGTILVQAADTVEETHFMLELAAEHDWILGVVGWVDMEAANAPDIISELSQNPKLVGIRPMIQDIEDDEWMLQDNLRPAIQALIDNNLTLDLLVQPRHLPHLKTFLSRYPDLRAVIDHGAKPDIRNKAIETWSQHVGDIARTSKVCCKLSGLLTEASENAEIEDIAPYAFHILKCFGPERVMFGSDWPVLLLANTYQNWVDMVEQLTADLPQADWEAIFGGTAAKFYLTKTMETL